MRIFIQTGFKVMYPPKENVWFEMTLNVDWTVRHGPFDILGRPGIFWKKIPCSDFD